MLMSKRSRSVVVLISIFLLTPIAVISAEAASLARAVSGSVSLTTAATSVVAGLNSNATTAAAHVASPNLATCFASGQVATKAKSGDSEFDLSSVTGIAIGMVITTIPGLTAGTRVTSVNVVSKKIGISSAVTSDIVKNTNLSFSGCFNTFFSVNNNGGIEVSSFGISQAVSTSAPDSITLQSCSGAWNEVSGACTGVITSHLATVSGTSSVIQVPIGLSAVNGSVRLRALCNTNLKSTTISITIDSTINFRSATITNE